MRTCGPGGVPASRRWGCVGAGIWNACQRRIGRPRRLRESVVRYDPAKPAPHGWRAGWRWTWSASELGYIWPHLTLLERLDRALRQVDRDLNAVKVDTWASRTPETLTFYRREAA